MAGGKGKEPTRRDRLKSAVRTLGRVFGRARLTGLILLGFLLAMLTLDPAPVQVIRLQGFDILQRIEPRQRIDQPVRVVVVDERSVNDPDLGQFPWSRDKLARIVDNLTAAGVKVIGFDAVFAEADRTNPENFLEAHRGALPQSARDVLGRLPSHDDIFAEAMRNSRVVLGMVPSNDPHAGGDRGLPAQSNFASRDIDPLPFLPHYQRMVWNIDLLTEAASGQGVFVFRPDRRHRAARAADGGGGRHRLSLPHH
jgi:adenylate cyclase